MMRLWIKFRLWCIDDELQQMAKVERQLPLLQRQLRVKRLKLLERLNRHGR